MLKLYRKSDAGRYGKRLRLFSRAAGAAVCAWSLVLPVKAESAALKSPSAVVYEMPDEQSSPVGNLVKDSPFEYAGDVTAEDGSTWHQVVTAGGVSGYILGETELEVNPEAEASGRQEVPIGENSGEAQAGTSGTGGSSEDGEDAAGTGETEGAGDAVEGGTGDSSGNAERAGNAGGTGSMERAGNPEESGNAGGTGNTDGSGNAGRSGTGDSSGNIGGAGNTDGSRNTGRTENADGTGNGEEAGNTGGTGKTEETGSTDGPGDRDGSKAPGEARDADEEAAGEISNPEDGKTALSEMAPNNRAKSYVTAMSGKLKTNLSQDNSAQGSFLPGNPPGEEESAIADGEKRPAGRKTDTALILGIITVIASAAAIRHFRREMGRIKLRAGKEGSLNGGEGRFPGRNGKKRYAAQRAKNRKKKDRAKKENGKG